MNIIAQLSTSPLSSLSTGCCHLIAHISKTIYKFAYIKAQMSRIVHMFSLTQTCYKRTHSHMRVAGDE